MRWSFYIDDVLVYPYNQRDLKIAEKWEDKYIRDYRKSLSGDIFLKNDHKLNRLDFDYIKTLESSGARSKHTLVIKEASNEDINFEFTFDSVSFDDQKETVSIKPIIRDKYTLIQEAEDIEVNVIEDGTTVETTCDINSYLYFYGRVYPPTFSGPAALPDHNISITYTGFTGDVIVILCTELVKFPAYETAPSGWTEYADLGAYKVYQRTPQISTPVDGVDFIWSGGLNLMIDVPPTDINLYTEYKIDLGVYYGKDCSKLWIRKGFYNGRANLVTTKTLLSYPLKDILNKILSTAAPDFTGSVKSGFLFMDELAGNEPYNTQNNYRLLYSGYEKFLIDMSDFRKPNAYESATVNKTTFAKIMENLCKRFNARWFIDVNGDLRIENVNYWHDQDVGVEVTSVDKKYSYEFDEMPNREFYDEAQSWNDDFKKKELLYGTVPAAEGTKEKTNNTMLEIIYTDIDGLNEHIDEISSDGFVLIERQSPVGVQYGTVRKTYGNVSGFSNLQNVSMSMGNCIFKYYVFESFLNEFTVDQVNISTFTLRDIKRKDIEFTQDEIPDVTKSILTWLGEGRVMSIEYKLTTEGSFKCELRIHE